MKKNKQMSRGQVRKVNIRAKLPSRTSVSVVDNEMTQQLAAIQLTDTNALWPNGVSIDEFTSHDFFHDLDACYRIHKPLLKDRVFVESWHSAICCNRHLFKDKVNQL